MLVNPGFDGSASGWTLNGTASFTTTEDVDDCSGSGSVELDDLFDTFNQCVPASPGQTYFFGYRFMPLDSGFEISLPFCSISFVPAGASCGPAGGGGSATATTDGDWVLASSSVISPPNTAQIFFNCSTAGAASGYFDQLYLSTVNLGASPF